MTDHLKQIPEILLPALSPAAEALETAPFAKEVRLFGFSGHFLQRYREQFGEMIGHVHRVRRRSPYQASPLIFVPQFPRRHGWTCCTGVAMLAAMNS